MGWLTGGSLTSLPISWSSACILSVACFSVLRAFTFRNQSQLSHIPTYGVHSGLFGTYLDAFRFIRHAREVLEEGYRKFHGTVFKVPLPDRWMVVVTSPELVDQVRLAKSSDLSLSQLLGQFLAAKYTVGEEVETDPYHNYVIHSLTKQLLDPNLGDLYDEVLESFDSLVPVFDNCWTPVSVAPLIKLMVCRVNTRLLIGLPLCRNSDWLNTNISYAGGVFRTSLVLAYLPSFLKPVIGPVLSPLSRALECGRYHLADLIGERLEQDELLGQNYEDKPNDFVTCLLDYARGRERTVDRIIKRIILVGMASVTTTSDVFTEALLNLAKYPHYAPILREEVKNAVETWGWTRTSLDKMRKLDSFLKETIRFDGIASSSLQRLVVNPAGFTFSNGLHIPYGTYISAPAIAIHHDERYYRNPRTFDGLRFCGAGKGHQLVTTNLNFLAFGHGRYACPGRFLAATEMKIMFAHLVLRYDIALDDNQEPSLLSLGNAIRPNPQTTILMRNRKEL